MTTYLDSSVLLKLYVDEPDSDMAREIAASDTVLVTAWLTIVEVRRNLARLLSGPPLARARARFEVDSDALALVSLDEAGWRAAAEIAEETEVRSLDAVHLASAKRLRVATLVFATFDLRQAQAARRLGLAVAGA